MLSYKQRKQVGKLKDMCFNIILFPIRCVYTPIYLIHKKYRKRKRYAYKKILKLVKYCIDFHLGQNEVIYLLYEPFGGSEDDNVYSYNRLSDISWGWNGEHKKVKKAIMHIKYYQEDEYIKAIKELGGEPMTEEEKKIEFSYKYGDNTYQNSTYYNVKNKQICKLTR